MKHIFFLFMSTLIFYSCINAGEESAPEPPVAETFSQQWYQGKAELTRYRLEQARYGEIHARDAVLIFVTEDFVKDRQVKYEFGPRSKEKTISVLKLNFTKKFNTGIYPYSIMTSIFTPVNYGALPTQKVTTSSQEWCGHTYMQLNNNGSGFSGIFHSYFQAEADQQFKLGKALLEDEVWTLIRLNPMSLPTGSIKIIPGNEFCGFATRKPAFSRPKPQ